MVPLIKENASSNGKKSFPGRVVPALTRPRTSESVDLLRGSVSESNGCGSERMSSSTMRCRMMRHVLLAMLLPCICHAQRIPVEIKSPMPLHEICTAPVQQDLPDHSFVGEGYTRIPYTAFSLDSMTQMMATDEVSVLSYCRKRSVFLPHLLFLTEGRVSFIMFQMSTFSTQNVCAHGTPV